MLFPVKTNRGAGRNDATDLAALNGPLSGPPTHDALRAALTLDGARTGPLRSRMVQGEGPSWGRLEDRGRDGIREGLGGG